MSNADGLGLSSDAGNDQRIDGIRPLIYRSVCSGIEAPSVAWRGLGWTAQSFSEIDPFCCALLKHYYPEVPNHGDFTKAEDNSPVDILVGGTPCQSFSVAGQRGGLRDTRGNLALEFLKLAQRCRVRWILFENVPGLLSSDGGRDFGTFLEAMVQCGYGFAYRIMDAQFSGLAQRRQRLWVVGYLGDWRPPAAVLFERESLRGDSPPRRQTGERVAPTIAARTNGGGGLGTDFDCDGGLVARTLTAPPSRIDGESETFIAHTLLGKENASRAADLETYIAHSLRADGFDASEDGTGCGTPLVPIAYQTSGNCGAWETGDTPGALDTNTDPNSHVLCFSSKDHGADAGAIAPTLRAMGHDGSHANAGGQVAVAFNITPSNSNKDYNARQSDRAQAITSQGGNPSARGGDVIVEQWAVRRLTPRECERLQGAPDDHTLVTYRGKPMADGPRYKMIGNSWARDVIEWCGRRIDLVRAEVGVGIKAAQRDLDAKGSG